MAFTTANKADYAFKKLFAKAMTDDTKAIGNEATTDLIQTHSDNIFSEPINSTPATAVSSGVAVVVSGVFVLDATSNDHTYFFQSGGNAVTKGISTEYGTGYEIKVTDASGDSMAILDARNWVYDYANGVFFQQTAASIPAPSSGIMYQYVGSVATDRFGEGAGGTGSNTIHQKWVANGPYQIGSEVDGIFIPDQDFAITGLRMFRGVSGTGGSTVIDLNQNGTSLYTTQENRPVIQFDDSDRAVNATLPDITNIKAGSIVSLEIDGKDSGNPKDLTIIIEGNI